MDEISNKDTSRKANYDENGKGKLRCIHFAGLSIKSASVKHNRRSFLIGPALFAEEKYLIGTPTGTKGGTSARTPAIFLTLTPYISNTIPRVRAGEDRPNCRLPLPACLASRTTGFHRRSGHRLVGVAGSGLLWESFVVICRTTGHEKNRAKANRKEQRFHAAI